MKIFNFRAENVKNLKVVEIRPEDGTVILSGKNGAGKSAILDSIFMALTGKKIKEPIRNGESRAEVKVDLGKYLVKKIFTAKGERLEVTSPEGAAYPSPQALLDSIMGELSFDPLHFANLGTTKSGERQQHKILSDLVGLNFDALNKKREELYDERTVKFREIKGMDPAKYSADPTKSLPIDALIGDVSKPAPGTPRVEISMADEASKVQELEKQSAAFSKYMSDQEEARRFIDNKKVLINNNLSKISDLERQATILRQEIENINIEIDATRKIANEVSIPKEIKPEKIAQARQAMVDVDAKNKEIRAAIEYDKKVAQLESSKKSIDDLTAAMDKIDREKKAKINDAKFPIEGLAIEGEMVIYNGKPLSQLSTGEQIRVSTAIAMALNPDFKVILVREGSLLDTDGMKVITDIAKNKDYQLWIERVADAKGVGIYIEDGTVADVHEVEK